MEDEEFERRLRALQTRLTNAEQEIKRLSELMLLASQFCNDQVKLNKILSEIIEGKV